MNATFVLSLVLAVPLGIAANFLYAMIKPWWDTQTEQRRIHAIEKLEARLKTLKGGNEEPGVDLVLSPER